MKRVFLNNYFLATGVLGENMFRSESIDFDGVTLIFIESFTDKKNYKQI